MDRNCEIVRPGRRFKNSTEQCPLSGQELCDRSARHRTRQDMAARFAGNPERLEIQRPGSVVGHEDMHADQAVLPAMAGSAGHAAIAEDIPPEGLGRVGLPVKDKGEGGRGRRCRRPALRQAEQAAGEKQQRQQAGRCRAAGAPDLDHEKSPQNIVSIFVLYSIN